MIGFVYKDFLILRRQIVYYLFFFGLYAVLAAIGVFPAMILSVMLTMTGMMLPMSSFSYDDLARWDRYAAATPAGRQGIVAGKYLFALGCILGGAAVVVLLQMVLVLTSVLEGPLEQHLLSALANVGVVLFIDAIILPIFVKFGAEKSRSIYMAIFVLIFGGTMVLGQLSKSGSLPPPPPAWLLSALPVVLALIAVGGFVLSYFIAQGIMAKKEL